jgi:peroxiredoxin
MTRMTTGDLIEPLKLETIQGSHLQIPHPTQVTHLQFRRFAGCPMCNLHIHSFVQRNEEFITHGIQEVAVFHSSKKKMLEHHAPAPFALIADPTKSLYTSFGVELSILSVLNPQVWPSLIRGVLRHGASWTIGDGTPFGLPADFLIDGDGRILACKYGSHASDHWEVDEVLNLAKNAGKLYHPHQPDAAP